MRLLLKQGFRIVDNSGKEWANERKDHHRNRAGRLYLRRLRVPATQKPQEVGNRQRGGGNFAPIFIWEENMNQTTTVESRVLEIMRACPRSRYDDMALATQYYSRYGHRKITER